jgi:hypothetical protein
LRGSFTLRAAAVARAAISHDQAPPQPADNLDASEGGEQIVIDFVDPDPLDEKSERAKALYDQGCFNVAIAQQLKCSKSQSPNSCVTGSVARRACPTGHSLRPQCRSTLIHHCISSCQRRSCSCSTRAISCRTLPPPSITIATRLQRN